MSERQRLGWWKKHMKNQRSSCADLVGPKSEEFSVNISLRQGNAICSKLFIALVTVISRKMGTKENIQKLLHADMAVVADGEVNLQERLVAWKMFSTNGLRE